MRTPDEAARHAIAGGITSTVLSITLGVLTALDLIGPVWILIVLPLFLITVFGGSGAYVIFHRARQARAETERLAARPPSPAR